MSDYKLKDWAYHRNGVSGIPFQVVLFEDEGRNMMAVRFSVGKGEEERYGGEYTAAFDVDKLATGDIRFMVNSWRGDVINDELIEAGLDDGRPVDRAWGQQDDAAQ